MRHSLEQETQIGSPQPAIKKLAGTKIVISWLDIQTPCLLWFLARQGSIALGKETKQTKIQQTNEP